MNRDEISESLLIGALALTSEFVLPSDRGNPQGVDSMQKVVLKRGAANAASSYTSRVLCANVSAFSAFSNSRYTLVPLLSGIFYTLGTESISDIDKRSPLEKFIRSAGIDLLVSYNYHTGGNSNAVMKYNSAF